MVPAPSYPRKHFVTTTESKTQVKTSYSPFAHPKYVKNSVFLMFGDISWIYCIGQWGAGVLAVQVTSEFRGRFPYPLG